MDFQAPADASVKAFFLAIGGIMERLDSWSVTINTRMIETATAFTGGIAVVITQLRNALEAFATLGDAKNLGSSVLTAFMGSLTTLVNQMAAYLPPNASDRREYDRGPDQWDLLAALKPDRGHDQYVLAAVQAAQATSALPRRRKVFERIGQYTGQGMARQDARHSQRSQARAQGWVWRRSAGAGRVGGSSRSAGAQGTINITFAA